MDLRKAYFEHYKRIEEYIAAIEKLFSQTTGDISLLLRRIEYDASGAFSFNNYPEIKAETEKLLKSLSADIEGVIVNGVKSEWTLSNNKNNELARIVFGESIGKLTYAQYRQYFSTNSAALNAFVKRKTNGLDLSSRVWNVTKQFEQDLSVAIDAALGSGKNAAALSRDIRDYLNNPNKLFRRVREMTFDQEGNVTKNDRFRLSRAASAYNPGQGVYRSSYQNAFRLARTEINMAYRNADQMRWEQMNFVIGYRISRSNNPYSCPICEALIGNYPKDFLFTGWHPNCRCIITPILQDKESFERDNEEILNGGEPIESRKNHVRDVPRNFKDWIDDNKDRIEKANNRGTLPYWARNNAEYVGIEVKSINTNRQESMRSTARKQFRSYGDKWTKAYFDEYSAGYVVYHQDHKFSATGGGGEAEKTVGQMLAQYNGKKVEFLAEPNTFGGKPDLRFDGLTWDIKYIDNANVNTIRKYIGNAQKADNVIFYYDKGDRKDILREAINREIGKYSKGGRLNEVPDIYYIDKSGLLKLLWKKE